MSAIYSRTNLPSPFVPIRNPKYIHFHARPEGGRRLVVPRVHNAAPHMLPYNHQRISVDSNDNRIQTQIDRRSEPIENTMGEDVRLGAVSSIASRKVSLSPTLLLTDPPGTKVTHRC
jgi:hypothetical protein